ncbi:hypothetical protein B0H11DRAFT_2249666 [Mycena galericulata]|nr:hypothetical protein B0H11DRAFT_2249666 [Mycena galericulata]
MDNRLVQRELAPPLPARALPCTCLGVTGVLFSGWGPVDLQASSERTKERFLIPIDPTAMQACFPNPVGALLRTCWGNCAEAISLSAFWNFLASGAPLCTLALTIVAMNAADALTGLSACDVLLAHAGSLSPQEILSIIVRANAFHPIRKNCEHLSARIGADIVDCACPEFGLRLGPLGWRLLCIGYYADAISLPILESRSLRCAALHARPQHRGSESPHALIPCEVLLVHAGSLIPEEILSILVRANVFRPIRKNCEHLRARIGADIVDCACPECVVHHIAASSPTAGASVRFQPNVPQCAAGPLPRTTYTPFSEIALALQRYPWRGVVA